MNYNNWKTVIAEYNGFDEEIKKYFSFLPPLAKEYPWKITLGYMFTNMEIAHNMMIYCGLVKLHKVSPKLANIAVNQEHISVGKFYELTIKIFQKPFSKELLALKKQIEKVRNKIVHGKEIKDEEMRKTVLDVLVYSKRINDYVYDVGSFKPFASLIGYKGGVRTLDDATSRWILKGMGFLIS